MNGNNLLRRTGILFSIILFVFLYGVAEENDTILQTFKNIDALYDFLGYDITVEADYLSNGDLSITWTDPKVYDETLLFIQRLTPNEERKKTIGTQVPLIAYMNDNERPIVVKSVIPGESYLIICVNDDGMGKTIIHTSSTIFSEFTPPRFTVTLKKNVNGDITTVDRFSAKALEAAYGTENFGIRLECVMPKLGKPRRYATRFVLVAPDGRMKVINYADEEYRAGGNGRDTQFWKYIPIMYMMDELVDEYGHVLTGQYEVRIYFDTEYVNSASFTVAE